MNSFFKLFIICLFVVLKISTIFSIRDGTVADTQDALSIVQLFIDGNFRCAGVLLSETIVVTVPHCLKETRRQQVTVKAGTSKLVEGGIVSHIDKMLIHKSYNHTTLDMDVVVLKLTEPIRGDSVAAAVLFDRALNHGDIVQVYGWGKIRCADKVYRRANELQTVQLKVIDSATCSSMYGNYRNLTDTMFCAATPAKGAGKSDSGGAAMVDGKVCGLVSWAMGYGEPGYPSVYTDLTSPKVQEFISKAMQRLQS